MTTQSQSRLNRFFNLYSLALLGIFALAPSLAIIYLRLFQTPESIFDNHVFHMIAITLATVLGLFVSYVTWRCYLYSGEVFLRWLTLGFLGFVIIYTPHGILTIFADQNPWLFLLYGPASRVVMAICFLIAILQYGKKDHEPERRTRGRDWVLIIGLFFVIDILVAFWALSSWRSVAWMRISMEYIAIANYSICILWMFFRRIHNPLILLYAIAIAWFAQSSLSFTYGRIWDHQWWLAHLIFASGFLLLSYGIVQAFLSTRSFARVYSQAELLEQLQQEQARTQQALVDLQQANDRLEKLAATDTLTNVANRREFLRRLEQEMARCIRNKSSLSLLLIDLDHFKAINDQHGHHGGDVVLMELVNQIQDMLRAGDLLGRIGGEEFAIFLTDTELESAGFMADRLRKSVEQHDFRIDEKTIHITISIGVVQYHPPAETEKELINRADLLLYQAKENGRNRIESEQTEAQSE